MKKLLFIFLIIFVECGGIVYLEDIQVCEKLCKKNGGCESIFVYSPDETFRCRCKDGMRSEFMKQSR